jgi:hypothetical protein
MNILPAQSRSPVTESKQLSEQEQVHHAVVRQRGADPEYENRGAIPTIFALIWLSRVQGSVTYFRYNNQAVLAAMATTIAVTKYL